MKQDFNSLTAASLHETPSASSTRKIPPLQIVRQTVMYIHLPFNSASILHPSSPSQLMVTSLSLTQAEQQYNQLDAIAPSACEL